MFIMYSNSATNAKVSFFAMPHSNAGEFQAEFVISFKGHYDD